MQRQQQRRQQPRQQQQQQPQDTAVDPTGREVAIVEEELPVGQIRGGKGAVGVEEEEAEEVVDVRLVECGNCGRRFAEDRVAKHEKTCTSVKTRKPYDTKKHRVMGADHENYALNPKYQKEEVSDLAIDFISDHFLCCKEAGLCREHYPSVRRSKVTLLL